jgi:hypothetical protein
MKKQIFQSVLTGTFIAAAALLASSVSAGDIKGAQLLLNRPAVSNIAPAVTAKAHDCAKCQDVTKEVTLASSKGAYQKTALVAEHACPTCDTRIRTEGQGKAAHSVAAHTCASGTTPSCCQ